MRLDASIAGRLVRDAAGLVPVVVQRYDSGEVLMLAWMNDEALALTLGTGRATYFSRSRGRLWVKGETSGHHQYVRSVSLDCDGDALLVRVEQVGPACHTGAQTCFQHALAAPADVQAPAIAAAEVPAPADLPAHAATGAGEAS